MVDLAEWHYVLKGAASDETYGRATDAARSALFYFIYNLLFILILLLKVIIVCRPPAPSPTQLTTLPSPHTHVNTNVTCRVSLWPEELSHRCVYYCSSSLTDRCICVSSERLLPELYGNCVLPHVRTHAHAPNHTRDSNARSFRSPGATNRRKRGLIYTI